MKQNRFVYLFEKFESWFFVNFITRKLIDGNTVRNRLSAAIYDTTINAITFKMNLKQRCNNNP